MAQYQKRVLDFVPLVENLLNLQIDFVFDIVGDGPDLASLQESMSQAAHAGRVHFHSRQHPDAMPAIWLDHDIFVQVSEFEGTSVSMLEAMAQGAVPVITATHSGTTSVVTSTENGFLIPIGDMQAMAQAIAELASKPDKLQALGQAAFNTARQYSMETYVETFSALIDQALASPPGRWPYDRCLMPPSRTPMSLLSLPFEVQQELINCLSSEDLAGRISTRKLIEILGVKISNQLDLNQLSRFGRGGQKGGWGTK
jgi:hypothetical protein